MSSALKTVGTMFSPAMALGNSLFGKDKSKETSAPQAVDQEALRRRELLKQKRLQAGTIYSNPL